MYCSVIIDGMMHCLVRLSRYLQRIILYRIPYLIFCLDMNMIFFPTVAMSLSAIGKIDRRWQRQQRELQRVEVFKHYVYCYVLKH